MIRRRHAVALLCGLALLALLPCRATAAPDPIERYRQALTADPDNLPLRYFLGVALLNAGRTQEALAEFRQAYPAFRTSIEANYNLSIACQRLDDLDGALLYLEQAEALGAAAQPAVFPLAGLYFNLALLAQRTAQDDEAIRLYGKVLEYEPGHLEAQRQLGGLHAARGDVEAAISSFSTYLAAVPDDPVSREFLFSLEFNRAGDALDRADFAAAGEGFGAALAVRPDDPATRYYLGYLATLQQQWRAAAEQLRLAYPGADDPLREAIRPLLYNCSLALRDAGQYEDALAAAQLLADRPAASFRELFLAGTLNLRGGRYLSGRSYLERARGLDPGHAGTLQNLIVAERGAYTEAVVRASQALNERNLTAAQDALATAAALQPDSPQVAALTARQRQLRSAMAAEQLAAARQLLADGRLAAAQLALRDGLSLEADAPEGRALQQELAAAFARQRGERLSDAQEALAAGAWTRAQAGFAALLERDAGDAEAAAGLRAALDGRNRAIAGLLATGRQALAAGRGDIAGNAFRELLELDAESSDGRRGLADVDALNERQLREYLLQGRSAAGRGRLAEARALFAKARQLDERAGAEDLARLDQAAAERADSLVREAGKAAAAGEYRQAEQLYGQALAAQPEHAAARQGRQALAALSAAGIRDGMASGDAARQRDDIPAALTAYRRVLALDPDHQAARSALQRIRQLQGERLNELVSSGHAALAAGNLADAGQAVEQALRLDPFHPGATRLRERIDQAGLGGAQPGDAQTLYLRGVALYTQGSYQEAIRAWETVLVLDPAHDKARQNIDKTRRKLRRIEEYRGG